VVILEINIAQAFQYGFPKAHCFFGTTLSTGLKRNSGKRLDSGDLHDLPAIPSAQQIGQRCHTE
jgi:hypothetical protein